MRISCILGVGTLSALVSLVDAAAFSPYRHGSNVPRQVSNLSSSMSSNSASSSSAMSSNSTISSSAMSSSTLSSSISSSTLISSSVGGMISPSSNSLPSSSMTSLGQPIEMEGVQGLSATTPTSTLSSSITSASMTSNSATGTSPSSTQSGSVISGSTALNGQPLGSQILQGLGSSNSISIYSAASSSTPSGSASSSVTPSATTTSSGHPLAPQILQGLGTVNSIPSNSIPSGATTSTRPPLAPQILQGLGTGSSDSVSSSAISLSSPTSTGPPYVFNGMSSALSGTAPSNSVPINAGISSSGAYRPPYGPPYGSQQATTGGMNSRPVSQLPLSLISGSSPLLSSGTSVMAPIFTLPSNSLLNAFPSNLSYPTTGPTASGPSNSFAKPIAPAPTGVFTGTAPSNLPFSISVPLNSAPSNSALPGSAQPTITANSALSNGTTSNATATGGCFNWLMQPIPCNCPGAYSSGGYTSLRAMTNIVTNTAVNPPVLSTEVITVTAGPPAVAPGQDTCGMACLIGADAVQILYWPVTTGQANLSITAAGPTTPYSYVSNGFTFTSPSVYVAYRGLMASAAYAPFGEPLGTASHDVTVGYPPEALSTSHCNLAYTMSAQQYRPINYTELQYPPPNSALTDCPHASGQFDVGSAIYNPSASNEATNAFFSVPGALNWVDPAWSTCIPVTYGVFDPPKALSKAVQMVPQTAAGASGPVAETAAPGSSATPAAAPVTVVPGALGGGIEFSEGALSPASVLIPAPTSLSAAEGFDPSNPGSLVLTETGSAGAFGFYGGDKAPSFLLAATALVPSVSVNEILATPVASPIPSNPPQQATSEAAASIPVVNTPSYNSVLMATPSSVVAAPTAAAQPAVSPVNAPVDNSPAANPPAVTAPAGNTPAGNAPAGNAPAGNSPVTNPPATAVNNPVVVASPSPVVIAGNTAAPASNGGVVIASSTYSPGSQATVGGQVISVGTNNIVQGGTTQNVPTQTEPTPVLVGENSIESAPSGGVVIASSTYEPGVVTQLAGTPISVGSSHIVVASSTHAIPSVAAVVPQAAPVTSQAVLIPTPVLVGGNSVANAPGGGVVIASSTYQPGVQAQISGTPISVGTDNIAVDSSTYALPTAPPATPVLIGGSPIAKASSGGIVIAGSTYQPGVVAQVAGTPISVGTDNVVINSQTVGLPNAAPQTPAPTPVQTPVQTPAQTPVLVGGQSVVKASGGGVVIGSSTIAPGSEATVSGTVVTAGTNNVVIGGNNYALPDTAGATLQQQQAPAAQPQSAPAVVAGQTVSRASNGGVVVGSSTIAPGQQATISGQVISAGPSNVAIGGSTYSLPSTAGAILQTPAPQAQPQTTAFVGGQSIARASNGGIVIGSSTIAPGSQATISGQVISAGPTNVAIGGSTYALPSTAGAVLQTPAPQPSSPVEVGGNSIVKAPNGGVVIGSSTIAPGSEATIFGQVISAGPSNVAIDGSTYVLPSSAGGVLETPAPQTEQEVPVQVGGNSISRASNGGIIIGSSTLVPGSEATISGQVVSAGATNIAIGGSTYDLASTAGAVLQTPSPVSPSNAPVVVAGQTVARASNGGLVVGTSTIAPGAQATISGHVFSAAGTGATNIAIDGNNYALPTTAGALLETPAPISPNIVEAAVTLANGDVISAGGPAAVVSGVTASVLGDDSGLVIGSKTIPLPPPSALTTSNAVYTVGGQTFTAAPSGLPISIDGTTISPGGSPITISGTVVALGNGALQIGSTIMPLPTAPSELFTVGGTTFAAAATGFAVDGTSLAPGGSAITISGTVVSLGTAGLQIGSSTIPLNAAELTAAAGGLVSGVGPAPTGFYNGTNINSTSSTLLTSSATLSGPTPLTGAGSPSQAATSTARPKTGMASRFRSEIWVIMTVILGWSVGIVEFML